MKMNWKIVFLGLISVLILSACIQSPEEPTELPEDFKLNYSIGAMHLEWGSNEFEVDSSGNAVFYDKMGTAMSLKYEFQITKKELLEIYKIAVKNNFFSLSDMEDPSIMDGGWKKISITANEENKTVSMSNTSNHNFDEIQKSIVSLIKEKKPEIYSYDSFKNACPEKEIECIESNSTECLEWKEYCESSGKKWKEETSKENSEFNVEYCDKLENRKECINYCNENICSEELCDILMFEAENCEECSAGCCSLCDLDSCNTSNGCNIVWVHPSGESWQFAGCENNNLCASETELCDYVNTSYQGYGYHAVIEENQEKAELYQQFSEAYLELFEEKCD
jgi:hypothetical protein